MPKFFRLIFIISYIAASCAATTAATTLANANDSLCIAPEKPKTQPLQTGPHPSADEYHQAMIEATAQADASLDWIEDPQANTNCGGYYQSPENPNPQAETKPDDADLVISALSAAQSQDGFTTLAGGVEVYQGMRRFRCDSMRFSEEQQFSELTGNIQLREPGLLLLAETAVMDGINQYSTFTDTEYVLHQQQAHGKASYIHITGGEKNYLTLKNTSFTLCPPANEYWLFDAKRLELDEEKGWGKLYSAIFKVGYIPVFYLPYIDFPIDERRKTGLLWPSFSSADHGGIDITLPYYFNIAPQFDLTYVPRFNSDHGALHGIEARYKHTYSEWSFGGTYIDNDKRVGDVETADDSTLKQQRWAGFIKENGRFNVNWSTNIDYQAVSDINYFRDWSVTGLDIKKSTNIRREATIRFADDNWKASSTLVDYQTLEFDQTTNTIATEEYRQLPNLRLYFKNQNRSFHPEPIFFSQYTFFDHDDRTRAQRVYMEPGITFPMRWQAGEIIPAIKLKHTHFRLNDSNQLDEASLAGTVYQGQHDISAPSFTLDNRLFLERSINIGEQSLLQTVTPRVYYYYTEHHDQSTLPAFDTDETAFNYQQLFRDNRFGSYDRIADADQISWALETELLNPYSGHKLFSFGVGQIIYFEDRKVAINNSDRYLLPIDGTENSTELTQKQQINEVVERKYYRDTSDVAIKANWHIDHIQQVGSDIIWDPYLAQVQETTLAYRYHDAHERLLNIAYRYKRLPISITASGESFDNNVDQADMSFYLPVAKNWHVFMRWNVDINEKKTIEDISGFKFEGCCYGIMLAYQRERKTFENNVRIDDTAAIDYRYGWFVQFELKGLGGVTNTITRLIEESIQGFTQSETNY